MWTREQNEGQLPRFCAQQVEPVSVVRRDVHVGDDDIDIDVGPRANLARLRPARRRQDGVTRPQSLLQKSLQRFVGFNDENRDAVSHEQSRAREAWNQPMNLHEWCAFAVYETGITLSRRR